MVDLSKPFQKLIEKLEADSPAYMEKTLNAIISDRKLRGKMGKEIKIQAREILTRLGKTKDKDELKSIELEILEISERATLFSNGKKKKL